jgi:hypothetical protein
MPRFLLIPLVAISLTAGCASTVTIQKVQLSDVTSNPHAFNGRAITVCGWTANQFEDGNITVNADRSGGGLAVNWCDNAPRTKVPTYGCVSGTVRPLGGMSVAAADGRPAPGELVTVSTGTNHTWEINPSCRD